MLDKIYSVVDISFFYMTVQASETKLFLTDISENEVFDLSNFDDFKISLVNNGGQAKIISIAEWKKKKDCL